MGAQCSLDLVKSPEERLWYAKAAIENGWSRNVLAIQIEERPLSTAGKGADKF